jgi:inosose dehydratase
MPRDRSFVLSRRGFLQAAVAASAGAALLPRFAATGDSIHPSLELSAFGGGTPGAAKAATGPALRLGYAAITWGGQDDKAVEDISALGFHGIQLRATAVERWGTKPEELRRLLDEKGLKLLCMSSGTVDAEPAKEAEYLATHVKNAEFVKAVGGEKLQILSRRPEGRAPTPAEFERLGKLLTILGQRTRDLGVPLVYHNHMHAFGEAPDEIAKVLELTDPKAVGLLLDIAHYQQGGGDPVAAVSRHQERLTMLHLKDVIGPLPGDTKPPRESYKFVELGRGKVDVKGVVAAVKRVGFRGPAVVELDAVTAEGRTPKDCAALNKQYCVETLGLVL